MKKVNLDDVLRVSKKLNGDFFIVYITSPKNPLNDSCTKKIMIDMLFNFYKPKLTKLINYIDYYSCAFKKAFIYVSDKDYIKYF